MELYSLLLRFIKVFFFLIFHIFSVVGLNNCTPANIVPYQDIYDTLPCISFFFIKSKNVCRLGYCEQLQLHTSTSGLHQCVLTHSATCVCLYVRHACVCVCECSCSQDHHRESDGSSDCVRRERELQEIARDGEHNGYFCVRARPRVHVRDRKANSWNDIRHAVYAWGILP